MSKVYLESTDTNFLVANNNTSIFGTSGLNDRVILKAGISGVTVASTIEKTDLAGSVSDYKFKQGFGSNIEVQNTAGATIMMLSDVASKSLAFTNGTVTLAYTGGIVSVGGTNITTTAATLTPVTIDATKVSGGTTTTVPAADTTPPIANLTSVTDNVGSVQGVLSSGASTDDTSLVLAGTCESGSTVKIYNGTVLLGTATVTGTSWSYAAAVADKTTYQLNVKETDAAGNTSAATANFTVTGAAVPAVTSSTIQLISKSSSNIIGNDSSYNPSISSDGRYVAFSSSSSSLVSGDYNGASDIFIKDTQTGAVSSDATGNAGSINVSISSDGRYVAFQSWASNLVSGDTNGGYDIFVKDTLMGSIQLVSANSSGIVGDSWSKDPSISANGRYIAFWSYSKNLASGDTNSSADIFVKDTLTGNLQLVSANSSGIVGNNSSYAASISADGRYVAFESDATNLVSSDTDNYMDVFVKDTLTGSIQLVSANSSSVIGSGNNPSISADGRYVAFESNSSLVSSDTNYHNDIFLKDTLTGSLKLISTSSSGASANAQSSSPSMSADGRYVAFTSGASNLVNGDTNANEDIFVKDTLTGSIQLVSSSSNGIGGDWYSSAPSISADGRYVTFNSGSKNLVSGDTNGATDIFIVGNPLIDSIL